MSVRSRAAASGVPVSTAKAYGSSIPAAIEAAEAASQMGPSSPFSPGEPLAPYDGFSRTPRSREYETSYNVATRPRSHERVSFETLKGLMESYDVAQLCVRHRIASLRSLGWKLVAAEGCDQDVSRDVLYGTAALQRPDGKTLFKPWLAKYLRDVLSYDAGTLYRMRNRAGRPVGLKVISGLSIAPLLDYWGDPPEAPAPAYVQYVNGLAWNWLSRDDLIYEPYDPQPDSVYGRAPLEDVLLNSNTDLRFQVYFLSRFTAGNLPAAFAGAPDGWTPDQIEQFQEYWDGFMTGNTEGKHQIRWIPGGSTFAWSNEKDFDDKFSLFLMRKTCSAFAVVPSDLGFTEDVNRSSGESQADVQHRVGDLPMALHIQDILTSFLQDDLQMPLRFAFDLGEEQDDRVDQANADKVYADLGAVGVSELREMRYGLTDPVPVPRFIMSSRGGPIPLASLMAVAGEIDPATAMPARGAELPREVFGGVEGVLANPPLKVPPLAEQEFGPAALPPAPPGQPLALPPAADDQVAKEGEAAPSSPTAGITSNTGIYGYDLIRQDDDEDLPRPLPPTSAEDETAVAKRLLTLDEVKAAGREARERELGAFRRFTRARRKAGEWRDFTFEYYSPSEARELNRSGAVSVAKAAGEVAVAGLAVLAQDTGRVLMIQRANDPDDPAAGKLEVPGGHLEGDESPLRAAWREWAEETGSVPPPGTVTGQWTAGDGIYQGIVWTTECEAAVPVRGEGVVPNPDDPDGDLTEAILWVDPYDLPGNPMVRAELTASLPEVLPLLGCEPEEVAAAKAAMPPKARPGQAGL